MATASRTQPATVIPLKRGNSLILGCTAIGDNGLPLPLASYTITAQARQGEQLVDNLVVEVIDAEAGTFELRAPGDSTTPAWPLGAVDMDIVYAQNLPGGQRLVRSTETFSVVVSRNVTQS